MTLISGGSLLKASPQLLGQREEPLSPAPGEGVHFLLYSGSSCIQGCLLKGMLSLQRDTGPAQKALQGRLDTESQWIDKSHRKFCWFYAVLN